MLRWLCINPVLVVDAQEIYFCFQMWGLGYDCRLPLHISKSFVFFCLCRRAHEILLCSHWGVHWGERVRAPPVRAAKTWGSRIHWWAKTTGLLKEFNLIRIKYFVHNSASTVRCAWYVLCSSDAIQGNLFLNKDGNGGIELWFICMCITVVPCFQRVEDMFSVPCVHFPVALFGSAASLNRKCITPLYACPVICCWDNQMEFLENDLVPFQKVAYCYRSL